MAAEKIPEANPMIFRQVDQMLEDPVAYLRREREESLRTARIYVDRRVSLKLAEQRRHRTSFGQRVLHALGIGRPEAPSVSG